MAIPMFGLGLGHTACLRGKVVQVVDKFSNCSIKEECAGRATPFSRTKCETKDIPMTHLKVSGWRMTIILAVCERASAQFFVNMKF